MPNYTTGDIRNLVLIGHTGAGKTTLADGLLSAAGAVGRRGVVTEGTSHSDFEREEKEHKHSIYSSILHVDHKGKRINFIDTPGSPDLIGQAIAALPAIETAVMVINAAGGIELVTRRLMEMAANRNLPRMIIINRIDAPDINLATLLDNIKETFGRECLPINLPAEGGTKIIDCLSSAEGTSDLGDVEPFHTAVIDQIVEVDEEIMEKYLGGESLSPGELHKPFAQAMNEGHVVPICFTNAKDDIGIPELLDVFVSHLPSPIEGNRRPFLVGEGELEQPFTYEPKEDGQLIAHVFKVTTDPFVGKLSVFRVHQGHVAGGSVVNVGTDRKSVKLSRVFNLQGKEHVEVDKIIAGDIGAVAKIEDLHIGDVMTDSATDGLHLKPLVFPVPMYGLAVSPKARGDETKISGALNRVQEEDPTFTVGHDPQTRELVIHGLGELHLRLVLERLRNRGLDMETRPPKIAYRETIRIPAEGHHRHKKQTGGAGQFGEVFLKIEPLERGAGFEFIDATVGGCIPGVFMPAVEKGVREQLAEGYVAGYPLQDIRVTITFGKHHPVDSKEVAFKTAGKLAFRDAISKAKPVLLEPIVNMEILAPADAMGPIAGDLSGRRGRVLGTDMLPGGMIAIKGQAPLAEVMQYQSTLKSITGGQGSYVMELSHYEETPPNIQQQVAAQFKPREEDE